MAHPYETNHEEARDVGQVGRPKIGHCPEQMPARTGSIARSSTSSVIAIAKTPSLNASSRDVERTVSSAARSSCSVRGVWDLSAMDRRVWRPISGDHVVPHGTPGIDAPVDRSSSENGEIAS